MSGLRYFKGSVLAGALIALPGVAKAQMVGEQAPGNAAAPDDIIVVTGTAVPVELSRIGSSLTVIDTAAIERRNHAYVQDILREVPGLAVNQGGGFGQLAQVRIRGAEANHTLVLIDGIEVSSVGEGAFDFSSLLGGNIARIEVLRGPQSGLYGSNALAGVINIMTKGGDGPLFDGAVGAGSFDSFMGRATVTVGDRSDFLSASGQYRKTAGISSAALGAERDGDRNATVYLRGGVELAPGIRFDGNLRFVDKFTEADGFDFSGGPDQGLAIDDDSYSDTRDISLGGALTLEPVQGWATVLSAAYTDGESEGGQGGTGTFGNSGDRLKLAGRSSFAFDTGAQASHVFTFFTDFEEERYRNTFPSAPDQVPTQRRDIFGLGAEYRVNLFDHLFLRAALRHDGNKAFGDATTYSLTGAWQIPGTGTRLHTSYGTGATNPTFSEQFGFSPGTFVGNPDLTPEQARGFDVGVEHRIGESVLVDVSYFTSTLTDEITSQFPTVVNDSGRSRREGIEVSMQAELGPIDLAASYTYLDATDPDGTREVRRPRHQASFNAGADFGPDGAGNLNLGVIYNGRMLDSDFRNFFTVFAAEKNPLDSYVVVRLAGSYRLSEVFQLTARVENLFDEQYQEVISYGTPGLAAYAGLRVILP
ncbi:TonB-dependent receptor [Altererythrobacter sp. KTW20L]|uniref:TonB-dependent receptor plug domain-containing protein n=1 Tax=Altererythrobacter sp. KTW20L TaxID=2942210 RepID=UPI0020BEBCA0|nr:TonB-dependent receptor [Altererythrobacter sp. KTW20L]MCL6251565.1 TonB-dependent receptor [Altererythrobacter sp. KTW20L]